jgi:hypothetical protein
MIDLIHQFRILEQRLTDSERRVGNLELRMKTLEDGTRQESSNLLQDVTSSTPTGLFWLTATGCNSLPLESEPVIARLMWGDVYNFNTRTDLYSWPADTTLDQNLTTDSSGYVQFYAPWPNWGTLPISGSTTARYPVTWNGTSYQYDPTGASPISGVLCYHLYTVEKTKYSGFGYQGTYPDSAQGGTSNGMRPGANSYSYSLGSGYLCWSGAGARPISAHVLTPTSGGGGGTFTTTYAGGITGTRSGRTYSWDGSVWTGTLSGSYHVYWSLNTTSKVLSCSLYHYSSGVDLPVQIGSEFGTGSTYLTVTASPTVTTGPFRARYDYTGTAIQTLTGMTTVDLTT